MNLIRCIVLVVSSSMLLLSCDNSEDIPEPTENTVTTSQLKGSGSFTYNDYQPLSGKAVEVYYHVPSTVNASTPILMVFHGGSRDALQNRDQLIFAANQKNLIVIVPEFSQANFPGGDQYNLGNVFIDGDNPSASTLNGEDQWTFSLVEPLFDKVKQLTANTSERFYLFGFSAGAQFLHRFLFFKPSARVEEAVAAASGWYTVPDNQISFPYGIKDSPLMIGNFAPIFDKKLTVLIGEADNDPNAGGLRRNAKADIQGTNRLSRAQYFFNESRQIAINNNFSYHWQYATLPRVGHDFSVLSNHALNSIFTF